jgi:hypothetical protein
MASKAWFDVFDVELRVHDDHRLRGLLDGRGQLAAFPLGSFLGGDVADEDGQGVDAALRAVHGHDPGVVDPAGAGFVAIAQGSPELKTMAAAFRRRAADSGSKNEYRSAPRKSDGTSPDAWAGHGRWTGIRPSGFMSTT